MIYLENTTAEQTMWLPIPTGVGNGSGLSFGIVSTAQKKPIEAVLSIDEIKQRYVCLKINLPEGVSGEFEISGFADNKQIINVVGRIGEISASRTEYQNTITQKEYNG